MATGYMVIADISGFTAFLTATELEHGPAVTADLLDATAGALSKGLDIEGLQGDAVFAIGDDARPRSTQSIVDVVQSAYLAFRRRQRDMNVGTSCECSACRNIPSLSLKIVVHHGAYVRQTIGGRSQVTSPDVIIVHRLLKNSVEGTNQYLLITEAAAAKAGIDAGAHDLHPHVDQYEHLGDVACLVADLEPVWQREQAAPGATDGMQPIASIGVELPVSPEVAWDWLITPERRMQYEPNERFVEDFQGSGNKPGVGAVYHCHHGSSSTVPFTIVDWKPYHQWTWDVPIFAGAVVRGTIRFTPTKSGTAVANALFFAPGMGFLQRLIVRAIVPVIVKDRRKSFAALRSLLAADSGAVHRRP